MKTISAEEFDRLFDAGEDISEYVDWSSARRPGLEPQRVACTLPKGVIYNIQREAERTGTSCNDVLVSWLMEHIERSARG